MRLSNVLVRLLCLQLASVLTACGGPGQSVSYAEFEKIKPGASYAEVVEIIGFEGRRLSSQDRIIGSLGVPEEGSLVGQEAFVWMNKDGSNVSVVFFQGRAISGAEWNLCNLRKLCLK